MTDQRKIPLPSEGEPARKSLLERAERAFGTDGFKIAPVPAKLASPANRQPPGRAVRHKVSAAEEATPLEAEVPAAPREDVGRRDTAAPVQAPVADNRVDFTSAQLPIDRTLLKRQGLIVPEGPVTALLEEFRIVKRQVLLSAREARSAGLGPQAQRVLVCSPLPGEGKTFCAANLALAIAAEKDSEVVLVDADFAKPSILSLFGLSSVAAGRPGLMDALADPRVPVEDCVIPTDILGLFVLPAGNRTASDSEYLASGRTCEALDTLTRGAPNRMVIFDSPPALAATPAAELARHVGQALVICRADNTGQSALEDALSLLSACPDIKLLLNSAHFSPSGRRFGRYYGYGGDPA